MTTIKQFTNKQSNKIIVSSAAVILASALTYGWTSDINGMNPFAAGGQNDYQETVSASIDAVQSKKVGFAVRPMEEGYKMQYFPGQAGYVEATKGTESELNSADTKATKFHSVPVAAKSAASNVAKPQQKARIATASKSVVSKVTTTKKVSTAKMSDQKWCKHVISQKRNTKGCIALGYKYQAPATNRSAGKTKHKVKPVESKKVMVVAKRNATPEPSMKPEVKKPTWAESLMTGKAQNIKSANGNPLSDLYATRQANKAKAEKARMTAVAAEQARQSQADQKRIAAIKAKRKQAAIDAANRKAKQVATKKAKDLRHCKNLGKNAHKNRVCRTEYGFAAPVVKKAVKKPAVSQYQKDKQYCANLKNAYKNNVCRTQFGYKKPAIKTPANSKVSTTGKTQSRHKITVCVGEWCS